MSRWRLVLGLAASLASVAMPALAQEEITIDALTTPSGSSAAGTTTSSGVVTESGTGTAAAKAAIASKASIRALLENGKIAEAEAGYLEWAAYWHEDDPALIIQLERANFMQQYKNGMFESLVALVTAGDGEAIATVRTLILAGGTKLTPEQYVTAIRIAGQRRDTAVLNVLRLALYHEDAGVVNAAIEALGNIGDKRVAPELLTLFDEADVTRSIQLATALDQLGAAKQVRLRFSPQLRFPQDGAREKAALTLAAVGDPEGWATLRQILTEKKAPYYLLALSVLGKLPSQESQAFVSQALTGEPTEQQAALASLNLFPEKVLNDQLLEMLRDGTRPVPVRVAAIELLTARANTAAVKPLRAMAGTQDEPAAVKAAAMQSLVKFGILHENAVREMYRQRFSHEDEDVARAARTALLTFSLQTLGLAQ